jgi:peptide/nickel transport system substrate-binding protein
MRSRVTTLLLVLVAACGDRAATNGDAATGGTIVIVQPATGSSPMIPSHAVDNVGRFITDNLYERLAEIGPELNVVGDRGFTPRLARSWQWAADSMSIAFSLDPRARWHDGRPVRASDVRFTVDLLKDPRAPTQYTSTLGNVDSVSVRDSLTAVAWFRRRSPEQFYDMTFQVYVMPEHLLKDIPRASLANSPAAQNPIGSGRFRFAKFDPGVRVELVADTAHYRGRPKLDRVIIAFAADPASAITQLLSGQADFYESIPPDVLPRLDSSATVRPVPFPSLQYGFAWFNWRDRGRPAAPHPILSDRRVRQAIAMALDREAMLRNVFGTRGTLASGPFVRALADTTVKLPSFDRAHAAALLDSAGWVPGADGTRMKGGRPLALGIMFPASSVPRRAYGVLMQEQLKTIGIRADVEAVEFTAFVDRLGKGNFDIVLNVFQTDPSRSSMTQQWGAAGLPPAGQNFTRYSNRAFDALVDTAARSFDPARADQYYHRAIQSLVDDVPAVFLYDVLSIGGAHKRLRTENLRANGWWLNVADWWIPAAERIDRDRIGLRPAGP